MLGFRVVLRLLLCCVFHDLASWVCVVWGLGMKAFDPDRDKYAGFRPSRSSYGWLSKLWSLFWVPNITRHLIFRVPKKGGIILTTTHMFWSSGRRSDYIRVPSFQSLLHHTSHTHIHTYMHACMHTVCL